MKYYYHDLGFNLGEPMRQPIIDATFEGPLSLALLEEAYQCQCSGYYEPQILWCHPDTRKRIWELFIDFERQTKREWRHEMFTRDEILLFRAAALKNDYTLPRSRLCFQLTLPNGDVHQAFIELED